MDVLKKCLIGFVLVALIMNIGLSATKINTDKDIYKCVSGKCEPVQINITTDLPLYTVKIDWGTSSGSIISSKLPYLSTTSLNAISLTSAVLPKTPTYSFYFNATAYGLVKFNISVYDGIGKLVARLDPYLNNYNNRIQINISSQYTNYTLVAVPVILNSSILGSSACVDIKYCNDSLVTNLNDDPIYFYNKEYNASSNWVLFVNMSRVNTSINSIYFYYNSTNITRSQYFNGNKVFKGFESFENYTDGVAPSGHFGVLLSDNKLNITKSSVCFDDYCLNHTAGATQGDIIYGFDNVSNSGIIEYRFRSDIATIGSYLGTNLCNGAYPCTWAGSTGNIWPIAVNPNAWNYLIMIWNVNNTNNTINGTLINNVAVTGNIGQMLFGYQSTSFMIDNLIWRDLIEDPLIMSFSSIETAPVPPGNYTIITHIAPDVDNLTITDLPVIFNISVEGSNDLFNCSLYINATLNATNYDIVNNTYSFWSVNLLNGTYTFNYSCVGSIANNTDELTLNVSVAYPWMPSLNDTTVPDPYGDPTRQMCLDNQTLYIEWIETITIDGASQTYNRSKQQFCAYGCELDKCNPNQFDQMKTVLFYLGGLFVLIILILIIRSKL